MKKDNNKLKWKNVYEKCNHNKYSKLTNIKSNLLLKANCKNFITNYGLAILTTILVLLLIFIYTFKNNPIGILYCIGIVIAFFLLALYTSTYKIIGQDNELTIYNNFQKSSINYKNITNIYLSRTKMHFLGFPINSYSLNIIYTLENQQMMITLPTVMLNKNDIRKFFDEIETKKIKDEEEELKKKERDKKTIIKTIIYVTLTVFAIFAIIYIAANYQVELL